MITPLPMLKMLAPVGGLAMEVYKGREERSDIRKRERERWNDTYIPECLTPGLPMPDLEGLKYTNLMYVRA